VICGVIFGPSPWPVDLVSAGLLLAVARPAARRSTSAPHADTTRTT
jgi:hypothetical protein